MKKILAMILALLMALTFIAPAFSDDIEIIINDPIDEQIEVLEEFELSLDLEQDIQTPFSIMSANKAVELKQEGQPGTIILQKTLINDVWHIRCDVMDGTTFQAGGGIWKTDVIMNPTKKTSKEGHRSNKCGDADHWIIWLDNTGTPFRMDEIKSGATGGTLPTMIFKEVYSPQDLGFSGWGELEPEMTDKVELYKENFKIQKDITTVKPGERIYWVTWNGNQRWYHSGIPYIAPPTFTFYIDGEPYPIVAGNYLELDDVLPGAHEIREDVSTDDYIITVFGSNNVEGTTSIINIVDGETVEVEYVNEIIAPPAVQPSTPPALPTATPTATPTVEPTATPILTETPTTAPTEVPTSTPSPTETPAPTIEPTIAPTETPSPTEEPTATPIPTEEPIATPTLTATPTIEPTISPTPEITTTPTIIPTEEPTYEPTQAPTETPTTESTATPTPNPTSTPIPASPTPTTEPSSTPTITVAPTIKPTAIPTIQPTDTPIITITLGEPSESPRPTLTPTETVKPTEEPTMVPTTEPTIKSTATPTNTPRPTHKPTPTPIITAKPTKTPVPTAKPTKTSIPATATPTVSPTSTPSATRTATPTVIPTATPTLSPTKTPTPRFTQIPETPAPTSTLDIVIEIEEPPIVEVPAITVELEPTPIPTVTPRPTLSPVIREIIERLPNIPLTPLKPDFSQFTDEELEELFDIWGYEIPLYGMLQTGDEIPAWVLTVGGLGLMSALFAILLRKKKD